MAKLVGSFRLLARIGARVDARSLALACLKGAAQPWLKMRCVKSYLRG